MKLTGKAKEEFEKWYILGKHYNAEIYKIDIKVFYLLEPSMQYGVYVKFFYNQQIDVNTEVRNNGFGLREFVVKVDSPYIDSYERSWEEAWSEAIEKANEIYNSRD